MPWMTLRYTSDGQYCSFHHTMMFNCGDGIFGTSWMKTTVASQKRAKKRAVTLNEEDKELAHGVCYSTC